MPQSKERVGAAVFWTLDAVRSPDEIGDGTVDLSDLVLWAIAFVQQTPLYQGDLDCNGSIDLSDLTRFQVHFVAP